MIMTKYYVYECCVSEIDIDSKEKNTLLKINVRDSTLHTNKEAAFAELRDILSMYCKPNESDKK